MACTSLFAETVTKTNAVDWEVDGSSSTRSVTFVSGTDFAATANVTDVNLSIVFDKTADDCPDSGSGGSAWHDEIVFRLSNTSRTRRVVNAFQYSNGLSTLPVTVNFDTQSANPPDDNLPESGTFRPQQSFNQFNGDDAADVWTLFAQDTVAQDPLCITSFSVSITAPRARITIVKTVTNDNSGTGDVDDFNITTSAGTLAFGVGAPSGSDTVYTSNTIAVVPGTFTLVEDDVANYTEGSWSCTDGTGLVSSFNNGSITLADGDNATCSITNDDDTPPEAELTIIKTIVNDNSGTAVVGDFNIATSAEAAAGVALAFGAPVGGVYTSNTLSMTPGTYTLVESDVVAYNEGSWSCTGGTGLVSTFDNGSITLADGDDVTCSITNDDVPPATTTSTCVSEGGILSGNIFTTADNGTFGVSTSTAGGTIAPTAPYAGFFQAETYDSAFPPNDGEYQILNQTPSSGFGSWDHPITDHTTGTTSGRFALSNMSNVLDSLFLQETVSLTANTNYELTIWVYNVCDSPPCDTSHDPRLEFVVNDGLYLDTGLIPYTGGWAEQAFIFNSADNISSLIKLVNKQALGTAGNDLAIDDYTIKECTLPDLGDITGTLYLDADGDNTFDSGETRLPANIRINLYGSDGVLYSHTDTDANGDYEFIDVPIAFNDYSIEVDLTDTDIPSGYAIGTPNPINAVTVVSGSSIDDQDFGFDTSTKLTIVKQVVNNNGGTATVSTFGITTSGGPLTFDSGVGGPGTTTYTATTLSVVPGSLTLIENDVANYAEGSWSCDVGTLINNTFNNGSLALLSGQDATCTIINDDEVATVDLSITKSVDLPEPEVGETITFTLSVSNAAGSGDATAVEVLDLVPAGFTYVLSSMTGGDLRDESTPSTGTGLKWTINNLPAGTGPIILTFKATVNPP